MELKVTIDPVLPSPVIEVASPLRLVAEVNVAVCPPVVVTVRVLPLITALWIVAPAKSIVSALATPEIVAEPSVSSTRCAPGAAPLLPKGPVPLPLNWMVWPAAGAWPSSRVAPASIASVPVPVIAPDSFSAELPTSMLPVLAIAPENVPLVTVNQAIAPALVIVPAKLVAAAPVLLKLAPAPAAMVSAPPPASVPLNPIVPVLTAIVPVSVTAPLT